VRHGVTFRNHYIAAAMCSPSRASFLTGQPPQVHHVFDQMEYPYTPSLSPNLPNVGSVLKGLGYRTAYFGKFEMDQTLLDVKPTINYSTAIQHYGFDVFSAGGDTSSRPQSGFSNDPFIAGEAVRYLHQSASEAHRRPAIYLPYVVVGPLGASAHPSKKGEEGETETKAAAS
jgi:arylsulfatase A-like enzyme